MNGMWKKSTYPAAILTAICLGLAPDYLSALEIPLNVEEADGYGRRAEAVSVGVPLPRGAVRDLSVLGVKGTKGEAVSCQFERLAAWPDSSVKWLLVDFFADCPANGKASYLLTDKGAPSGSAARLKVEENPEVVTVETGVLRCRLDRKRFDLFGEVWLDHDHDGSFSEAEKVTRPQPGTGIKLTDDRGREITSRRGLVKSFEIEAAGPVRATLAVKGTLGDPDGEPFLDYTARLHFYAGSGLVRVFFTLENHDFTVPLPGSHWVLGRPGNVLFEDLTLAADLKFEGPIQMSVGDGRREILDRVVVTDRGGIYQESSGGENWFQRNHMNREGRIPLRFRGAQTFLDGVEPYPAERPDAWLQAVDRQYGLAVAVRHFWQNFPKSLAVTSAGTMQVGLWPEEFPDFHELQGGEIKTHEVAFYFHTGPQGRSRSENPIAGVMGAFHKPLIVRAPAEVYLAGGFFDDAPAYDPRRLAVYERYQQAGLTSAPVNLTSDNEAIDEYGWRNFGDSWAKNEADKTGGPHQGRLVVSHYNLEYDLGYGMLFQSLRTLGAAPELSRHWWDLAEAALRHESDIDVYHCTTDPRARGAYNGGKFTHTQHGVEAGLATHRGGPRLHWFGTLRWPWGEGGSPESGHFNTRGQMCYYYLTGDRRVLESALEQTELVYRKVTEGIHPQIDQMSREAGNNLQILTDAFLLTWDDKYRQAAEKVLESTAPEKQWYTSAEGRAAAAADQKVEGFWTAAICIDAAARWTGVMEEKTGRPYRLGRDYVVAYADFVSRYLAGGPQVGFYSSWSPSAGGRGEHGPWTYRLADIPM
ncbi:MAG: hypothetical protein V1794_07850, partial [Candidatus Glassbacteria bacterium]